MSIIVPVATNRYIHPNLSWALQDMANRGHEIVIVLDGAPSAKSTIQFLNDLRSWGASRGANLKIVQADVGSPGLARNIGMMQAARSWFTFWDADDLPHPQNIDYFLRQTISSGSLIGVARANMIDEMNNHLKEIDSSLPSITRHPGLWRIIFHKYAIQGLDFLSYQWGEDKYFIVQALTENEYFKSEELIYTYVYRRRLSLSSETENSKELVALQKKFQNLRKIASRKEIVDLFLFQNTLSLIKFRHPGYYWSLVGISTRLFCLKPLTFLKLVKTLVFP